MVDILHQRFEKHPWRHEGIRWEDVAARLAEAPDAMAVLQWMEETGGEPDERTPEYYEKRPCPNLVWQAARILDEMLAE